MSGTTTLYWHDYETFGTNPRLDRPAQFAGQRTDLDLNPIGDPLVIYCQPPKDVLPRPEACLVTGITPQRAAEKGMSEPDFMAAIHAEIAAPNTCTVGYNSLRFDDEVTRHTLWRNFYDPYRREWADGCSRWDIIDMVRMAYALRPEGIEWPSRDDGATSFRLEDLAAANGLEQNNAHDALSDVHATIALARLIRDKQPKLFDYAWSNRDKKSARAKLDLETHKPVLHVSDKYPASLGCLSLVMPLAAHPFNKNGVIVFDLRHDPADLLRLPAEDLRERLFTPNEDLPEGVGRLPIKTVHINKCPVLAPVNTLDDAQAERLQLDMDACRRHWKTIHDDMETVAERVKAVFADKAFAPNPDPEQALYDGFTSDADRNLCERVRGGDPAELANMPPFEDERLGEMLFRYRARHYPDSLTDTEAAEWQEWRANRIQYAPDGGLSIDEYQALVSELPEHIGGDPKKMQILMDLQAWGERLRS